MLVGERGPSYTDTSQLKNWKLFHIRFIKPGTARPDVLDRRRDKFPYSAPATPTKYVGIEGRNPQTIHDACSKYVNNTGDIYLEGSEVSMKAETFIHYTYVKLGKKLTVVDIQGKGNCLCNPEIPNAVLRDANDNTILLFCH